jgi:nucleotide-binding universal stress UspA family protein
MPFAAIMVHVDVDPRSVDRVRLAGQLAQRFGSTLIGISASVLPPYPSEGAYFVTGEIVEQERRDIAEVLKRTEHAFRSAAGSNLAVEWRSDVELPEAFVVSEARSADLLIVGRDWVRGDVCRALDPGAVILRTGRPILTVPPGIDALKGERLFVAWKESREARRALYDSLPFLKKAKSVAIAEVCDKGLETAGKQHVANIAQYLARHGVMVASTAAVAEEGGIGQQLIGLAKAADADLLVAGAYGHSRLGEWIFGGATRELLKLSPMCCLLSN